VAAPFRVGGGRGGGDHGEGCRGGVGLRGSGVFRCGGFVAAVASAARAAGSYSYRLGNIRFE